MVLDATKFSTEELLHDLMADIRDIIEASTKLPEGKMSIKKVIEILNEIHERIDDIADPLTYDDYCEDAE